MTMAMVALAVAAQAQTIGGNTTEQVRGQRDREKDVVRDSQIRPASDLKGKIVAPPPPLATGTAKAPPNRKMTEAHKHLLYPSAEERERFAAFLRQPHTGLVRLLPETDCQEDSRVVRAENSCLEAVPPVPGGGSFYSFASGSHQAGRLADLWLKDGRFRVGFAGENLSIMTALGDVPLEAVSLQSRGADYLSGFAPPGSDADAQRQYERNRAGFRVSGQTYGISAAASENTTYVLRSITYKEGDALDKIRQPTDVLVSFRVVGKAADGSVTILWKVLRRRPGPRLKS
jgi:hypothetical protein